jgi:multimeric flavodoxin WrbA
VRTAPNIAVIYHSRHGAVHGLATAAADGAGAGGANVRLVRVPESAHVPESVPESAHVPESVPESAHVPENVPESTPDGNLEDAPRDRDMLRVPVATHDDLVWAHGLVLAGPTYFGNISHPLKRFIDSTSPLWRQGALVNRVVTAMTSSNSLHGGREATLLALYNSMYHWGALVLPAGGTDPASVAAGANPYGVAAPPGGSPEDAYTRAARDLGLRLCDTAGRLAGAEAEGALAPAPGRVAVLYCPDGPATYELAAAVAQGARGAGADVRMLRVGSTARGGWTAGRRSPRTAAAHPRRGRPATPEDVEWADAVALGTPARAGNVAPRLMEFIESCEPLRTAGRLRGKAATGFVTTAHPHGGSESALLSLYNSMHHWGAVIVAPGYADPSVSGAGGNPYGTSYAVVGGPRPDRHSLTAASFQGRRLAWAAARLSPRAPSRAPGPSRTRSPATR